MLEMLKEPASKETDVMCLKVEPDSRMPMLLRDTLPWSVPQENWPVVLFQRSLSLVAPKHPVVPFVLKALPKNLEAEA